MNGRVLIVSPEAPYPLHSGGAWRTASLLHYFTRIADVDMILFSESGQPALLPRGLVRAQYVIPLPKHSRSTAARYFRNASRAIRGIPPLIDRLGGFGKQVAEAIGDRRYDIGVAEHFWCAPYIMQMRSSCRTTILDLHNIESALHRRCTQTDGGLPRAGHQRFAGVSRRMESKLLPQFSLVLTTSDTDAAAAQQIAPKARIAVYPNALPTAPVPHVKEDVNLVVFSGNFEYHPNVDAARYFFSEIWPGIRQQIPSARVRLVGRGHEFVRRFAPPDAGIEWTGPVDNAMNEIARAAVVIAPLRAGSGTRIKILEAWSAAKPVVATPLAAEGLTAEHGVNLLLAPAAAQFVLAVVELLGDSERRGRIGAAGRISFEQHYTWQTAWSMLDRSVRELPPPRPGGYTE